MGVVHGLNPYTTIPLLEPHRDPAFAISNWHRAAEPVRAAVHAAHLCARAARAWPPRSGRSRRSSPLSSLAMLALVWRCAELLGRSRRAAIVFVGLNPLVLVWGLGADHNDALMMLLVVLALYLALLACGRGGDGAARAAPAPAAEAPECQRLRRVSPTAWPPRPASRWRSRVKASAAILLPVFLLAGQRRAKLAGAARGRARALEREPMSRSARTCPSRDHAEPARHTARVRQRARRAARPRRRDGGAAHRCST